MPGFVKADCKARSNIKQQTTNFKQKEKPHFRESVVFLFLRVPQYREPRTQH
jgi:hypothetical protein